MPGPYDRSYEGHIIHGPGEQTPSSPAIINPVVEHPQKELPSKTSESRSTVIPERSKATFGLFWD